MAMCDLDEVGISVSVESVSYTHLGVKSTRVKQLLKELLDEGVVVAEGNNKNRVYKLKR